VDSRDEALTMFDTLASAGARRIKIGPVLMLDMSIPDISRELTQRGFKDWFMDAKFSNTDSILVKTAQKACDQGSFTALNCMADSGPEAMMRFAGNCRRYDVQSLAVSFLTTKDDSMAAAQHNGRSALEQVLFYANEWIAPAGMDGMVCSAQEASALRESGYKGVLVCPGIRFVGSDTGDQRRVMTPAQAIQAGADYLVMSRGILGDPVERIKRYVDEVGEVM
jgi:orotidine-5'-phosphate decarboxylase